MLAAGYVTDCKNLVVKSINYSTFILARIRISSHHSVETLVCSANVLILY